MRRETFLAATLCVLALALVARGAGAQVTGLYYQEVAKDGRIYVFNTPEKLAAWQASGDMGVAVTLIGRGANGETLVGENETAIDLYLFRHNLPAYERPTPKPPVPPAFPKTSFGFRFFGDVTSKEIKDKGTGVKSSDSGTGIDVKRFYFTATHAFDAKWSAQFQSDIGDVGAKRYDVFVKKANLQYTSSPQAIFRLGAADTPWVPFVEGIYGQRYFEQTITDSLGFGTSAEWGLHFLGKAVDNKLGYAFTVGNGKGYSSPSRSKSVDFEGRLSFEPLAGLTFAVGGYSGKRGLDTDTAPAKHTATRINALANYVVGPVKIGGEYFSADNWNNVTTTTQDKANGFSSWLQYSATPELTIFGRYDSAKPSQDLNPKRELTYLNAGVQWKLNKSVSAAAAYKYAEAKGGVISTGNGSIGSSKAGFEGVYHEVGVWAIYDF
jgi:hypothetical protein